MNPKLSDIIEKWLKEDSFLSAHFIIKHSAIVTTMNLSCYHDAQYHSYDQFVCWITDTGVETDSGDNTTSFPDRMISIQAASPNFFEDLKRLLYELHAYYSKYCRPKWTHPKK